MENVKKLKELPKGWRYLQNETIVDGKNYVWACNNKSRFSGEYEHALIERV